MLKIISAVAILISTTVLFAGSSLAAGKRFLIFVSGPNGTSQASTGQLVGSTVPTPNSPATQNTIRTQALWGVRLRNRF